jgi:hypothetical protein
LRIPRRGYDEGQRCFAHIADPEPTVDGVICRTPRAVTMGEKRVGEESGLDDTG